MNLKSLSEKQLVEIINNTKDLELLEQAEEEWVRRFCPIDNLDTDEDQEIIDAVYEVWRQS